MIKLKQTQRANIHYWLEENPQIDTFYVATEDDHGESEKLNKSTGLKHVALSLTPDGLGPLIFVPEDDIQHR